MTHPTSNQWTKELRRVAIADFPRDVTTNLLEGAAEEIERLQKELLDTTWQDHADRWQKEALRLRAALETICNTFEKDEVRGYRSRDRQYVIEIGRYALSGDPPAVETTTEPPLEFYIATYGRRVWDAMPEDAKQVWRDHVAKGTHSPETSARPSLTAELRDLIFEQKQNCSCPYGDCATCTRAEAFLASSSPVETKAVVWSECSVGNCCPYPGCDLPMWVRHHYHATGPSLVKKETDVRPIPDMVCEQHPTLEWPHDDCPGPGMPPCAVNGKGDGQ